MTNEQDYIYVSPSEYKVKGTPGIGYGYSWPKLFNDGHIEQAGHDFFLCRSCDCYTENDSDGKCAICGAPK